MQADFYLLDSLEPMAREHFACRILEKAYKKGHKVFVFCDDEASVNHLDELLWTFKDDSFIPHNIQGEGPEPPPAIQIGHQTEPRGFNDILLNMSKVVPTFYNKFSRIIEIIDNNEIIKEIGRAHYKQFKQAGLKLQTHTIELTQTP